MVYYRKYRPQTISELDSSTLRTTLTAVLSRPEIPHAFLLTGPKGLGKTSTARIIAKVVNCEGNAKSKAQNAKSNKSPLSSKHYALSDIEPCGECDQCISITNGSNLDVLEIDGASNRGIDEIRDLRDKVKLAPSQAKKKVYIIDEVHMLTTEAFNALLKTIEEPPAHVMFIFCTTEVQKIPETIVSRCFHINLPKATNEDIVRSLKRIKEGEKLDIDDDVLEEIAKTSDGGFRDATKSLEEVVMMVPEGKITLEKINKLVKTLNIAMYTLGFLKELSNKNIKKIFERIQSIADAGIDMKVFIKAVLEDLHALLLKKVLEETKELPEFYDFSIADIKEVVALLSLALQDTKYAAIPQLPLELAVVTWCQLNDQVEKPLDQSNRQHPMDTLLKKERNLKVQSMLRGTDETKEKKEAKVLKNEAQEELTDKNTMEQFMENLIYKIKPLNFSIAGVLRGSTLKKIEDGKAIFATSYKFHKDRLDEPKTRDIIEQAIKEVTGKPLRIVVELKG